MQLSLSRSGRSRILLWGVLAIGAIFVVRLFWLQVIDHAYYEDQANREHILKFTLQAKRGLIYAMDGSDVSPLVLNQPVYLVYADPQEVDNKSAVVDAVRQVAGGSAVKNFDKLLDSPTSRYAVLAKQLTKQQAQLLKDKKLAGIGFQESEQRVYPEATMASQLLGYVNADGQGQYGVEGALNNRLTGKSGELKAVTDVRQIPLTVSDDYVETPAKDGDNIVLTIDKNIQAFAENALKDGLDKAKATKGSIVVLDPQSGHVMAMANYPTYDPSKYNEVTDYSLFQNNVVSEPYEVGSVVKSLTIGTGLDTGAIKPDSTYDNTGKFIVDGQTIRNVESDPINPHASVTDILLFSLNTGVDWTLSQMGGGTINQQAREKLYHYFHDRFQLGVKTGIEQAGETAGVVRTPDDGYGLNFSYANMAFGQGMDITTLQMAAAFSAAINGGTYYAPQLVAGTLAADGSLHKVAPKVVKTNVLTPATSSQLRQLIVTARNLGPVNGHEKAGFIVGGKTGTAQVLDPKTGTYSNDNPIGTYVGFGGAATPRYVIMVKVNDAHVPGYAGSVAAGPIFNTVSNWLLNYLKVQPGQ